MVRISATKCFLLCITMSLCIYFIFRCDPNPQNAARSENVENNLNPKFQPVQNMDEEREVKHTINDISDWHPHTLAVIVPFRDRFEELMEFAPWIHTFLNNQKIPHKIVVVNQIDSHRFNRASLINIGFLKTRDECDYLVMHDVDLLPNNVELLYHFPEKGPYHLASPEYHPMYHYKTYIGGVLMMSIKHFQMCRGLSNTFWGWGREDDELYLRFRENSLTLYRPTGLSTGYETFKHIHDKERRPRDYKRYGEQKKTQFQRDKATGYDTLRYTLESERVLTIDEAPVHIYNVELFCDKSQTPWCDHSR
ncbi:beta-1,4-galactosyltransferase 7-like [Clavelina lepadiformis]|uniref:beta-1,4-galactosyltransferase 7-like n=1 Tax=Clavelina lepadiformis TaxID=159417 RepID=UPI004042CB5E